MASHVALLRGINVGGRNKVPMAELRDVVTSLGHDQVKTYSFAFAQWVASTDNIQPLVTLIGHDTETVLPEVLASVSARLTGT